jgi:hypothetical protein
MSRRANVLSTNATRVKEDNGMKLKRAAAITVCVMCCLTFSRLLHGQAADPKTTTKITELENESVKAQLAGNTAWIKANVADGYVEGSSFGEWTSKAELLKDMEDTAKNKVNSNSMSDLRVTTYGTNVAIARYRYTYDAMIRGEHRARTIICSDTWINAGGAWKEAAAHCSQAK